MTTLRIEHAIHDYDLWKTAFDGFADVRAKAGVRAFTIHRPVDNPKYLMLDLEFDTTERADAFSTFLEQNVWSSPTSSPGLAGVPHTQILDLIRKEDTRMYEVVGVVARRLCPEFWTHTSDPSGLSPRRTVGFARQG